MCIYDSEKTVPSLETDQWQNIIVGKIGINCKSSMTAQPPTPINWRTASKTSMYSLHVYKTSGINI